VHFWAFTTGTDSFRGVRTWKATPKYAHDHKGCIFIRTQCIGLFKHMGSLRAYYERSRKCLRPVCGLSEPGYNR